MINYKIVGKKFEPKEQITLGSQGDNLVETVVFEMNKFHNNIDLSKGSAYIHTITPAGVKETSLLENISDDEDSDLLKLKWDVGYKHTRFDGRIRFQISIQKEDNPLWASDLGTFIITKSIFDEFNISEYRTREKEPVIIIERSMHIPENTKTIGVEGDNVSESVTFVVDRYYDGQDLFIKKWYVEVLNAEDEYDVIEAKAEEKSSKKINVIWTVTARHTAKAGEVKAKLRVTEKDTHHYIWQSFNGVFVVEETFGEKEIVVDPGLGVIDELLIKAEKIKDEIHEIFESISTNAPKIDEDNEWIIYNPETNEYEKTGVNASGKPFTYRGDYNADADPLYTKNDVVRFGGGSFVYINDVDSNEPTTSTSHWQQIAEKGDKGNTGDSGVYVGPDEPENPEKDIWVNPEDGADLIDLDWQSLQSAVTDSQLAKTGSEAARDTAIAQAALAQGYAAQLAAGTASPAGTYANLAALIAADPDHSKIYITLDDGKWCYHNGSAWVAGGVYQAAAIETDKTLTVSGAVADAKVTGDKVGELKSALDEITETSGYQYVQIANVTKYPNERWYYPNGTGPTSDGATRKTAIEFACDPLADYDICGKYAGTSDGYPIFVMDASYTILDTITTAEQVTVDDEDRHTLFTTPANAAIIRYNVATDVTFDSQRVKTPIIKPKGVTDLQADVADLDIRCDALENDVDEINDTVDAITENEILGYTQIADVTKYPDQRWYLQGTGPTSDGASGKTALEFACQPNTAYAICGKYAGTSEGYPIIIMDSSDTVLDTITDAAQTEYQGVARFTFFTTPANAAKVRYNVATDASFDQQLEAVYYLAPKGFSTLTPNILAGKKWAALGDSFTAYTNKTFDAGVYKTKDRVYSRLIAERNHMQLLDGFFASGRTLAYPSDGTFTNSVTCPTAACYYQNIPADVDYITIMLGINDEHHYTGGGDGEDPTGHIELGTISDSTTATYYGAWNVMLSWLIANRPNAHIGIIVTNGLSIPEWRQAQIDIAQKYGVAYIDLNGDQITPVMLRTVNANIDASVKAALVTKWAVDPTGAGGEVNTHPNWQAHEYEAAFIEDFLRRI